MESEQKIQNVSFDYIKSNFFRVVQSDGIYGGITPQARMIQMAFYSERSAIPKSEKYELENKKVSGSPKEVEKRDAIVREVEVDVHMDIATATAFHTWLGQKIEEFKNITEASGGE